MTTRVPPLVRGVSLLVTAAVLAAVLGPSAATKAQIFSTQSELVVLNVTVTNKSGSYVAGLDRQAFTLFDNGEAQPVTFFSVIDQPVTVGLLVDDSASMVGTQTLMAAAAESFAAASNPVDEMFALLFSDDVRPALPPRTPFASTPGALKVAVERAMMTRGRTALHDAVLEGIAFAGSGHHSRRALVVVSDGEDTASTIDFDQLLRRVQASSTVIYTVAVRDPSGHVGRPDRLRALADATGGLAFRPHTAAGIESAFAGIARDMRSAYTLGYVPPSSNGPAYHRLRVTVTGGDRQALRVRTRQGYLAAVD